MIQSYTRRPNYGRFEQVFRTPARPEGVLWARGAVMSCVKDAPEAAKAPCHMMREERTDFWRSSGRAQTLQILPLCGQSAQAVFQNKLILPIFRTHFGTRRRFPKKGWSDMNIGKSLGDLS